MGFYPAIYGVHDAPLMLPARSQAITKASNMAVKGDPGSPQGTLIG
jgi:hypothetical protein